MSTIFKNQKKKRKKDVFDIVRYIGWFSFVVAFFYWGFGTYEHEITYWVARGCFLLTIILNIVYEKFIYRKARELDKKKR